MIEASVTVRFRLSTLLTERADPLSQSELSRRSGVSMTTINAIALNKTKQVSLATLDALSAALEVAPGDLLEREARRGRKRS